MAKDKFNQRKLGVLSKKDKSSIGQWDKKILKLCEKINKKENYYTTSSCSGRIVIMIDKEKKQKDLFLKMYHNLISFSELRKELESISKKNIGLVKFKLEPCILHVVCKSVEDANILYNKAKLSGWKKSGIIALEKNIVLELNSTEKLEFPIIDKFNILVGDEFLKLIVKQSNQKMKRSWIKIQRLNNVI